MGQQIAHRQFDPATVARASKCLKHAEGGQLSQDDFGFLLGLVRALAEQQRMYQYRLDEPLLPYSPHDRLLASAIDFTETDERDASER